MKLSALKNRMVRWLFSVMASMPWWMAYALADVIYFILCHVWGYRRGIILKNLRDSFPEKTDAEIKIIIKRFYRNFADQIAETLKTSRMSVDEMRSRMTFNPDDMARIDEIIAQGRPVVIFFSHSFNWEWAASMPLWSRYYEKKEVLYSQIYRPLRNSVIDGIMLDQRNRFGAQSLPKKTAFMELVRAVRDGRQFVTGFMSDQHPSAGDPGHIMTFLNHPTAMISGTETVARKLNAYVLYWDMSKVSRGHYHIDTLTLSDNPRELPDGEITRRYARALEKTISRDPAIWLWSHNRWKRPVELTDNIE